MHVRSFGLLISSDVDKERFSSKLLLQKHDPQPSLPFNPILEWIETLLPKLTEIGTIKSIPCQIPSYAEVLLERILVLAEGYVCILIIYSTSFF